MFRVSVQPAKPPDAQVVALDGKRPGDEAGDRHRQPGALLNFSQIVIARIETQVKQTRAMKEEMALPVKILFSSPRSSGATCRASSG
jgi:hypothetical protein